MSNKEYYITEARAELLELLELKNEIISHGVGIFFELSENDTDNMSFLKAIEILRELYEIYTAIKNHLADNGNAEALIKYTEKYHALFALYEGALSLYESI